MDGQMVHPDTPNAAG